MDDQRQSTAPDAPAGPRRASRRRVLASLGAGAAAVGLAGCGDPVSDAPSYERREVGDVDGEPRSAAETTAAAALAEQDHDERASELGALTLADHEFVLEDDFRGATVQGTVRNTGDDRIRTVEVRVRVLDDRDRQLGRYLATTGDLAPGSTWSFTAILLEKPATIAAYEIATLGVA